MATNITPEAMTIDEAKNEALVAVRTLVELVYIGTGWGYANSASAAEADKQANDAADTIERAIEVLSRRK